MEILIIIANLAFTVFTCFAVMGVKDDRSRLLRRLPEIVFYSLILLTLGTSAAFYADFTSVHPAKVNGCIIAFLCLELIGSFNLKKLFTIPTKYDVRAYFWESKVIVKGGIMYSQYEHYHLPSRTTFTDGEYKI